jgi:beta-N-acetylhexosaminidase
MISCLKHFPGHGDVTVDSHESLPFILKSAEALQELEFVPFQALHSLTDVIMTAHLMVPALDADNCVTLSRKIVTGLLKEQMGFQGIVMTDSLAMAGILNKCSSIEETAIRSFEAGHDLILLAGGGTLFGQKKGQEQTVSDVLRVHQALMDAVNQGRISEDRLDESVNKILRLKAKLGNEIPIFDKYEESFQLAQTVAEHSVEIQCQNMLLPVLFDSLKVGIYYPKIVEEEVAMSSLLQISEQTRTQVLRDLNPSKEEFMITPEIADWADLIILCTYNGWKNSGQLELAEVLYQYNKPVISLVLRDPQDAEYLAKSSLVICTYSPVPVSIDAAIKRMRG